MPRQHIWKCPKCRLKLKNSINELWCESCGWNLEADKNVFDFIPDSPVADSFGYQWNKFPQIQLDSFTGECRSRDRFLTETNWGKLELNQKVVLDAGCGSGRFSEIALDLGSNLVALDASSAIFAAQRNLGNRKEVTFVKASLLGLPFEDQAFDYVYCIGVLQHTSDPFGCIRELGRVTKTGGGIALTFYEKTSLLTLLYSKYLVRPFTKRIPGRVLLSIISISAVIWFPLTNFLFRLPGKIGNAFRFIIPVANYVEYFYASKELQRVEAILDTFDMLSPEFDSPLNKWKVIETLESIGFKIINSSLKGNIQAKKL